jgi:hypothetical protein
MEPGDRDVGDVARAGEPELGTLQFGIRPGARLFSWILIIVSAASLILMDVALIVRPRGNPVVRIIYFVVVSIVGVPFVVWLNLDLALTAAPPAGGGAGMSG